MKRIAQTVLAGALALAAQTGLAQAGRSMDNPLDLHKATAGERAAGVGGIGYAGRPSDSMARVPVRSEGTAEFAVMEVQSGTASRSTHAHNGRPMDNAVH